jgi:hypothetical protein
MAGWIKAAEKGMQAESEDLSGSAAAEMRKILTGLRSKKKADFEIATTLKGEHHATRAE